MRAGSINEPISMRNRWEEGRGVVEKARVGLGLQRGSVFTFLMCSHLGRPLCEAPLTAAYPIQAGLSTCPLLFSVLTRHREAIRGPESSAKRKESGAERDRALPWCSGAYGRGHYAAGPNMTHGLVLAGAGQQGCQATVGLSLHRTLPWMSQGAACEWLRTESGLMLLTS